MEQEVKNRHPQETANFLSFLTFFYTLKIFKKASKKFEESDLFNVIKKYDANNVGVQLHEQFETESSHRKPSIYRLLWKCYGREYLLIGIVQLIMRSIMITVSPWAIGRLISYFTINQTEMTKWDGYFYAGLVIALNILNFIYLHNYMLIVTAFGFKIRTAFSSLIYRKCLRMSNESLAKQTVGKIVTLLTKDVNTLDTICLYANDVWIGFVQIFLVCGMIYTRIGVAAFSSCAFFLLMIPIQVLIGRQAGKLRMEIAEKTDARIQTTQEALNNIKTIKMCSWEGMFLEKINLCRNEEVKSIVKLFIRKVVALLIGGLTSRLAFFLLIMTCIWQGNTITAELIYFILSSFQRLRQAVNVLIPLGIIEAAELRTAAKRITDLLESEEVTCYTEDSISGRPKIVLNNVSVSIDERHILKSVSLSLTAPGLIALTGPVGCGKTTLLNTLLREHKHGGHLSIEGRISYASQEPWIFPGTIKENIIFGQQMDMERYNRVLEVCALIPDLKAKKHGDETRIGDKGFNLSRGQKARINLARAVYRKSDIYLLDQCLTSFDENVRDFVLKKCFHEFLDGKLCILAMESQRDVMFCDWFASMQDNGTIESFSKVNRRKILIEEECEKNAEVEAKNLNLEEINEESNLLPVKDANKMYFEEKVRGKVENITYRKYIRFGGGYLTLTTIVLVFLMSHTSKVYMEKMVNYWANLEQNISICRANNLTNTSTYSQLNDMEMSYYIKFSCVILALTLFSILAAYIHFNFTRKASNNLHKSMITSVLHSVLTFFDSNRIGNVLNRFSKDLTIIDEQLPFVLYEFLEIFFTITGIVVLLLSVKISFLIQWIFFFISLYFLRIYYLQAGRNLQRLDTSTKSPVIGHLNASLDGLTTIRTHHESIHILQQQFDQHQNVHTSANYTLKCCVRGFGFALDMLCVTFITSIVIQFLTIDSKTLVGDVGMAITQAFSLTGLAQYGIRHWADIENKMTSVERSLEYTEMKQESKKLPTRPQTFKGRIVYENVTLKYQNETALSRVNFSIEPGEKIGIVGRTGAGKSSIISALLRLYEIHEGRILLDNINTKNVPLRSLRANISVIPQDPVLFETTIRDNLDAKGECTDNELWQALNKLQIKDLFHSLSDKCTNFSIGEKQLICLARSLISPKNIIVFDEATSNLDEQSDLLLQNAFETNFSESTVIIIAHKLKAVMKCDKVMVIEDGHLIEFGAPLDLLNISNGTFQFMAKQSGISA